MKLVHSAGSEGQDAEVNWPRPCSEHQSVWWESGEAVMDVTPGDFKELATLS